MIRPLRSRLSRRPASCLVALTLGSLGCGGLIGAEDKRLIEAAGSAGVAGAGSSTGGAAGKGAAGSGAGGAAGSGAGGAAGSGAGGAAGKSAVGGTSGAAGSGNVPGPGGTAGTSSGSGGTLAGAAGSSSEQGGAGTAAGTSSQGGAGISSQGGAGAGDGGAASGTGGQGGAGTGSGEGGQSGAAGTGGCAAQSQCGEQCVDLQTDGDHCGSCGTQCLNGSICIQSECGCPGKLPKLCGGTCRDTDSDVSHCGACNQACLPGNTCFEGKCVCSTEEFCGGECKDLTTDPAHCGACDTPCAPGALCLESSCHELVSLGQSGPVEPLGRCEMALDATDVFWSNSYEVRRVGKESGAQVDLFGEPGRGLALDSTHVYWTVDSGSVLRKFKSGAGAPEAMTSGLTAPGQLVVDDTNLYWLGQQGLFRMKKMVSAVPSLLTAGADSSSGLAASDKSLYFKHQSSLVSLPKTGGSTAPVSPLSNTPRSVVLDSDVLYYAVDSAGPEGGVWRLAIGGDAVQLAQGSIANIAVDDTSVYFMTSTALMKVAKSGGTAVTVFPVSSNNGCVAVDAQYVFWLGDKQVNRLTK